MPGLVGDPPTSDAESVESDEVGEDSDNDAICHTPECPARAGVGPDEDDEEAELLYLKWLQEWRADVLQPGRAYQRRLGSRHLVHDALYRRRILYRLASRALITR